MCPFDNIAFAVSGKSHWDPVNRVNRTSWVAVVTQTDRPKSVRNRCVIEMFGCVFLLSRCLFLFSSDLDRDLILGKAMADFVAAGTSVSHILLYVENISIV